MAQISIDKLSFHYDGSFDKIFDNVSFNIDSDWKLGFVGRNGRGKTTFLKLLMGEYEYSGKISSSIKFDYFPLEVKDKTKNAYEVAETIVADYRQWKFDKELNLLEVSEDCRWRPFNTLSGGEQTKILLAALFSCNNNFLLIDEPTNHLDVESRKKLSMYLDSKKGYILVSHDRGFLDGCVDHILSINKANIELQNGNFSSWLVNKERQDNFEISQNKKLKKEAGRLKTSAQKTKRWADKGSLNAHRDGSSDSRTIGFKAERQRGAAKLDGRARRMADLTEKTIKQKAKLLKNIEITDELKLMPLLHRSDNFITANNIGVCFGEKVLFENLNFTVSQGERISIIGKNGVGKTSLLKLLTGEKINYSGRLNFAGNLKISYVPQDTSFLTGSIKDFARDSNINEVIFLSILFKLGFARTQFEKDMKSFSAGQKKKVLLAKSLCEEAHLYIWDEPLNYIDVFSRIQIENLILKDKPTLIFVEHDEKFIETIATKSIEIR